MAGARTFVPGVVAPVRGDGSCLWFAFRGRDILVRELDAAAEVPLAPEVDELGVAVRCREFLGTLGGSACFAAELEEESEAPDGLSFATLRSLHGRLDDELYALAGRAAQIVEWNRTHRFCGRCGSPTRSHSSERAKECPACGHHSYPRLAPAVITLVERGDEMLLARSPHFAEGVYSCLAGFVEPGESLEEAVAREIGEEVGIAVDDIAYFGSQPWPYPNSLMIGFTARYADGDLVLDEAEIADARWFTADRLPPQLPGKLSIARQLVDSFLARHGPG